MRNTMIVTLASLGLVAPAPAAEVFGFKVAAHPQVVVRGLPAEVSGEIFNASGRPVKIAYGTGPFSGVAGPGFEVYARTTDASGRELKYRSIIIADPIGITEETLAPDWHQYFELPVRIEAPGTYKVEVIAKSNSPETYSPTFPRDAWWGEEKSEAVTITIQDPTGVDLTAYNYFNGNIMAFTRPAPVGPYSARPDLILREFPTSRYAAYVVWVSSGAIYYYENKVEDVLDGLVHEPQGNAVPCTEPPCYVSRSGLESTSLSGEAYIAWRQKWYDIVLKAHPDIWFADELKFQAACDQFQLGNLSACAASLEALAKQGRLDAAEKAGKLLTMLKAKHMLE